MAIEMLDNDYNFVVSKAKRCFQPNNGFMLGL